MLSAIGEVNKAVELGSSAATWAALHSDDACLTNLDEHCKDKYQRALADARAAKPKVGALAGLG